MFLFSPKDQSSLSPSSILLSPENARDWYRYLTPPLWDARISSIYPAVDLLLVRKYIGIVFLPFNKIKSLGVGGCVVYNNKWDFYEHLTYLSLFFQPSRSEAGKSSARWEKQYKNSWFWDGVPATKWFHAGDKLRVTSLRMPRSYQGECFTFGILRFRIIYLYFFWPDLCVRASRCNHFLKKWLV